MKKINKVLLSIKNASYQYSDAEDGEYALKDVSFDFEKGKVYAIRGRSGTGKTTLLSLISGLERCTEGDIIFDGKNLKNINLDYYRSHDIGIVFQSYNLLPFMTASENIVLSMDASGIKVNDKKAKALELMKSVGLKESYASRKVLRLSGGEQQRVAIARSLSYNPKMIVADEPTGNLDKQTEEEILEIFKNLAHKDGKCVIIVTHSANVCNQVDKVYDLKKVK
jgi:putative ABC transport system ATP-binding protein